MKKIVSILLVFVLVLCVGCLFVGCKDQKSGTEVEINIAVPDGAPALAIAKMLAGKTFEGYKVNYEIVDGTNIAAKITAKQVDLAIVPTNLGANLYNKGVKIKTVASNVYGLLYMVGTEEIASVSSLKGQKILCTGQGGTPDFILQYLLNINGIATGEVEIEYISQGSDAIAALKAGTAKFAVLGEPAATMSVNKAGASILLNLQEEWEKSTGFYGYPQACTIVTDELFSTNSAFLKLFLKEMKENLAWISNAENLSAINEAIASYEGKTSFASVSVINNCNIKYVGALESKSEVESYLEIMASFNSAFIGGKLPDSGFYAGVALE